MKTKKCVFCSESIPKDAKVCPICGERLPEEKSGNNKWIPAAAVIAGVVVLGIVAVALLHRDASTSRDYYEEEFYSSDYDYEDPENGDEGIPEGMWMHSTFVGTLSGGGKSYQIELGISYPAAGDVHCEVTGGYQYQGQTGVISLEGDWIDLNMGREVLLCLYSDEYLERFDLEFDGEDLLSTTTLTGTWSKYANKNDYEMADNPKSQLSVTLKEKH